MSDVRRGRSRAASGARSLRSKPVAAVPVDPVALLDQPLGMSGLSAAPTLRRAGRRLGLGTVRDLLFHLPRRYDDLRELQRLGDLHAVPDGTVVSARVRVTDIRVQQTWRRRVQVTTAFLADDTGTAEATWFGRRFIERRVRAGDELLVSGRLKRRGFSIVFDAPEFQRSDAETLLHVGRIVPVYRLTAGLTAARLRQAMREALDRAGHAYPEYLPPSVRREETIPAIADAIEAAHYPTTFEARDAALRRLAFDELLALQLGMVARRRARGRSHTLPLPVDAATDVRIRAAMMASLSRKLGRDIELTPDQSVALDELRADLARPVPMLRLIQGDVGSGKTAVAAWALAAAALPDARRPCSRRPISWPVSTTRRSPPCSRTSRSPSPCSRDRSAGRGAATRSRRSHPGRRGSLSGRTRCSRTSCRSPISRWRWSTSSTGSAWSSEAPSRPRRPVVRRTSC